MADQQARPWYWRLGVVIFTRRCRHFLPVQGISISIPSVSIEGGNGRYPIRLDLAI
ncbi:MAG: hypothetical protein KC441_00660 [Anaerolineales bacterium]|nr:hypothetical protein [Anaerolineales bacterium]